MTARKDRKGRYHNTLDQPALPPDQADQIRRALGFREPVDPGKEAARIHRAAVEPEPEA